MRLGIPGLLCALALFAGTCAGLATDPADDAVVDAALIGTMILAVFAWLIRRASLASILCTISSIALLGFVSAGLRTSGRDLDAPVGLVDPEPFLVRFEARLSGVFRAPDVADTDLLDRFQPDADRPPWNAPAELIALHDERGRVLVHGRVIISAPTGPQPLSPGDRIEGVGWLSGPERPLNPGERDLRLVAWHTDRVGRLRVDSTPTLIAPAPWPWRVVACVRTFADRSLVECLQGWCDSSTCALVVAMTTGRHLPGYAALRREFAATGLSHFLAISGFNVAVLFVTCGVIMEWIRVPGGLRGWVLVAVGTIFLVVVDVEVSVLRAGIAGILTSASMVLGRAWRSHGLLAAAAIFTLVTDPRSAWNTGFQLSYLAVLALRHGSQPVDRCLRAPFRTLADRTPRGPRIVFRCLSGAFAASLAASVASIPVTLAWFGSMNPWCAIASTLLGPVAAALTVTATLVVMVGSSPWIGSILGASLAALAGTFRIGVAWIGTWPGCSLTVAPIPWWWAVATLTAIFGCWIPRARSVRRIALIGVAVLASAVMLASGTTGVSTIPDADRSFRWTALAVGDGSVHVLQSGGLTTILDAGTVSRVGAGSATVVPALRSMGIREIDTVVVSHPHLDHFSALPELLEAFPVRRVLLTEAWFDRLPSDTAPQALLDRLNLHRIEPRRVIEGTSFRQGPVTWRCLHPPSGFRPALVNDGSAAFLLVHDDLPDRPLALLLGDAQDQSIALLLARRDVQGAVVMELPHHGGWRPMAQALCEWVRPAFVMQSTGSGRMRRDRFKVCLRDAVRGVTCRDGAIRFSLDPSNPPAILEHWSGQSWVPLHPD